MSPEPCPVCKGKCCRDQDCGYRIYHMAAEDYEHWCDDCYDGTKYVTPQTYQQGIAEGRKQGIAQIVAYLRTQADAEHPVECGVPALSPAGRGLLLRLADHIERSEHHNERRQTNE
jgi:hypothetical protein